MIEPLRDGWRIDEDKGYVPDKIKERVRSEANYEWAKKNEPTPTPKFNPSYKKSKLSLRFILP